MAYVFIGFLAVYGLLIIFLKAGWRKAMVSVRPSLTEKTSADTISVIIPAHNEATTIGPLLEDLSRQEYDANRLEIIVVDDHSSDETASVVRAVIARLSGNFKLLSLANRSGKKQALQLGIAHAQGNIIVTTDADCRVEAQWIQTIGGWFGDQSIKMVCGGVRLQGEPSFFSSLQSVEWNSLIGTGAATLAQGVPTMCNGANLAFRKAVFHEVGGYEGNYHIASGDDEFLLRKVWSKYPGAVRYNNLADGVVETAASATLKAFFYQRVRWAGKWSSHKEVGSALLAAGIFLFHLAMLVMIPWLWQPHGGWLLAAWFLMKVVPEYAFLSGVSRFLKARWSWSAFFVLELTYSFYVVFFAIMSNISAFEWKGRRLPTSGRKN